MSLYGRATNDYHTLRPGSKEYGQAVEARKEMLFFLSQQDTRMERHTLESLRRLTRPELKQQERETPATFKKRVARSKVAVDVLFKTLDKESRMTRKELYVPEK